MATGCSGRPALLHRLAARLRALIADWGLLYSGIGWAAATWLLDATSPWAFVWAYGSRVDIDALLVSYGLANVFAAILGVGPGELLVSHPAGGLAYLSLRARSGAPRQERWEELVRSVQESVVTTDRPREWLKRPGLKVPGAGEEGSAKDA